MSRAAAWIALTAALALVAAGAAVGHGRARQLESSPLPSASSTGPRGLAAARLFLSSTARASVRLADRDDRPRAGAVVLLAAPEAPIPERDAEALLAHAAAGGTLVWMAGRHPQPALARSLSARTVAAPGDRLSLPLAPHPLFRDLALRMGGGTVASADARSLPVLGADGRVTAVSVALGGGEVLLLSGPEALSNERIGDGDAITLLVRLAARGPIAFDERWLRAPDAPPPPSQRGLLLLVAQALLAGAVLVAARARRLGAVRPPPPEESGRTARDYLASLAALYRRAGAEREVAAGSWRRARRELERRTGIPARLGSAEAHARLARRSPAAAEAFARGEAALQGERGALLAVARAAHDLSAALRGRAPAGAVVR